MAYVSSLNQLYLALLKQVEETHKRQLEVKKVIKLVKNEKEVTLNELKKYEETFKTYNQLQTRLVQLLNKNQQLAQHKLDLFVKLKTVSNQVRQVVNEVRQQDTNQRPDERPTGADTRPDSSAEVAKKASAAEDTRNGPQTAESRPSDAEEVSRVTPSTAAYECLKRPELTPIVATKMPTKVLPSELEFLPPMTPDNRFKLHKKCQDYYNECFPDENQEQSKQIAGRTADPKQRSKSNANNQMKRQINNRKVNSRVNPRVNRRDNRRLLTTNFEKINFIYDSTYKDPNSRPMDTTPGSKTTPVGADRSTPTNGHKSDVNPPKETISTPVRSRSSSVTQQVTEISLTVEDIDSELVEETDDKTEYSDSDANDKNNNVNQPMKTKVHDLRKNLNQSDDSHMFSEMETNKRKTTDSDLTQNFKKSYRKLDKSVESNKRSYKSETKVRRHKSDDKRRVKSHKQSSDDNRRSKSNDKSDAKHRHHLTNASQKQKSKRKSDHKTNHKSRKQRKHTKRMIGPIEKPDSSQNEHGDDTKSDGFSDYNHVIDNKIKSVLSNVANAENTVEDIPLPIKQPETVGQPDSEKKLISPNGQRTRLKFKLNRSKIIAEKQHDTSQQQMDDNEKRIIQNKIRQELIERKVQRKLCNELSVNNNEVVNTDKDSHITDTSQTSSSSVQHMSQEVTQKRSTLGLNSQVNLVNKHRSHLKPHQTLKPKSVVKPLASHSNTKSVPKLGSVLVTNFDKNDSKNKSKR